MTTRVFLYGTLRSLKKLAVVLGRDDAQLQPVTLSDYQVFWDLEGRFPVLAECPGASAEGGFLDASDEDLARLDWYEGAFGYDRSDVQFADGAAVTYASGAVPLSDRVWTLEDWLELSGDVIIRTAAEAMRFYPELPAGDMGRQYPVLMARAASELRAEASSSTSAVRRGAGRKGVSLHSRATRHLGFFAVDEMDLTHRRFDGGTERIRREVFLSTDATLLLPYDPASDQIVLVEQFRAGLFRRGERVPWSLEPVAGLIDPGETPEDCGLREAREEAGLEIRELVPMPGGYPSPGATAEYYHLFIGLTDLSDYQPRTHGLAAEGEDILTHVLGLDTALDLLDTGESNVLPLAYMLTWAAAHRMRLKTH